MVPCAHVITGQPPLGALPLGTDTVPDTATGLPPTYPVRDLLGFCTWALSFAGNKFFWRGEPYQFGAEGRITPVQRSIDFAPERVPQAHQQMDRAPSAAATGD